MLKGYQKMWNIEKNENTFLDVFFFLTNPHFFEDDWIVRADLGHILMHRWDDGSENCGLDFF